MRSPLSPMTRVTAYVLAPIFLVLFAALSATASVNGWTPGSQPSGAVLLNFCKEWQSRGVNSAGGAFCQGFVMAASARMSCQDTGPVPAFPMGRGAVHGFRANVTKDVTLEQLVDIVVSWLQEHPEELHRDADALFAEALSEALPCGWIENRSVQSILSGVQHWAMGLLTTSFSVVLPLVSGVIVFGLLAYIEFKRRRFEEDDAGEPVPRWFVVIVRNGLVIAGLSLLGLACINWTVPGLAEEWFRKVQLAASAVYNASGRSSEDWSEYERTDSLSRKTETYLAFNVWNEDATLSIFAEATCGSFNSPRESRPAFQNIKLSFRLFNKSTNGVPFKSYYQPLGPYGEYVSHNTTVEIVEENDPSATVKKAAARIGEYSNEALLFFHSANGKVYSGERPNFFLKDPPHLDGAIRVRFTAVNGLKIILKIPVYSATFERFFEHCSEGRLSKFKDSLDEPKSQTERAVTGNPESDPSYTPRMPTEDIDPASSQPETEAPNPESGPSAPGATPKSIAGRPPSEMSDEEIFSNPLELRKCIYPSEAEDKEIEGYVTARVTIEPSGVVSEVEVMSSQPPGWFEAATVECLSGGRYLASGRKIYRTQTVNWRMQD